MMFRRNRLIATLAVACALLVLIYPHVIQAMLLVLDELFIVVGISFILVWVVLRFASSETPNNRGE